MAARHETLDEQPMRRRYRWWRFIEHNLPIIVIYLILGVLYESFIHPLTILSGLPSAGVGALATLMLFRMELNVYGFVGLIMLVGIVKKNAIMMIDVALEAERAGATPAQAIY